MVWKLQISCRQTLWHNRPLNKTQKNPIQIALTAKSQATIQTSAVNSRGKNQAQNNTRAGGNNNNNTGQTFFDSNNKMPNKINANSSNIQKDRKHGPVYPPCDETCVKTNLARKKSYPGANAANSPPPWNRRPEGQNEVQQTNAQNNSDVKIQAAAQTLNWKGHVITP